MLETKRLLIRNFEIEDAPSCLVGWGRDKNLGKYILGYPAGEYQMEAFVSAWAENKNAWVIVEKESKNCIGYITIDIPYIQVLSDGGVIIEPIHELPWSKCCATIIDKFGVCWWISI